MQGRTLDRYCAIDATCEIGGESETGFPMSLLEVARQAMRGCNPSPGSPDLAEIYSWLIAIGEPDVDRWISRCTLDRSARNDLLYCARNPTRH